MDPAKYVNEVCALEQMPSDKTSENKRPVLSERFDDLGRDGKPRRLGIMGGTFDPIHFGHLICAEQARERFALDGVLFMPAGNPARKQNTLVVSAEDRYRMVCIATRDNPYFDVSRFEIDRPGITYTLDTLRAMRAYYPTCVKFYFITGADAIWDILTWRGAEEMSGLATFVGATRPGYDLEAARRAHEEAAIDFDVEYLDIPALSISSSDLRRRVASGKSIRYLTPGGVASYIVENKLYT